MKDLIYPSAYHAMKAGPCRVGVCKHGGRCGKCKEYGALRRYAARDTDRIQELRSIVKELADEKRISDAVVQSLRDKELEMAGEIAAMDAESKNLRSALKPVLELEDIYDGHWPFASLAADAVKESQRIYKEVKYIEEGEVK